MPNDMPNAAPMIFCVDSDGCVFDNMRIKHERAFLPAFIEIWDLEPWAQRIAGEWLNINLYSRTRGINRFAAFAQCLQRLALADDPGLLSRLPDELDSFVAYIADPANRNVDAIAQASQLPENAFIYEQALRWSQRVNERVHELGASLTLFEGARAALQRMAKIGQVHVVSQAPHGTLRAEWETAGLADCTFAILGQEYGSKSAQVAVARDGRDIPVLLVGDAPGDEEAATSANAIFFPIIPQAEVASWVQLDVILQHANTGKWADHPQLRAAQLAFREQLGIVRG